MAEDSAKLSLDARRTQNLLVEADLWAAGRGAVQVTQARVMASLTARRVRSGEIRRRIEGVILSKTLLIDTDGARVTKVNALAVMALGGEVRAIGAVNEKIEGFFDVGEARVAKRCEISRPRPINGVVIPAAFLQRGRGPRAGAPAASRQAPQTPISVNTLRATRKASSAAGAPQ